MEIGKETSLSCTILMPGTATAPLSRPLKEASLCLSSPDKKFVLLAQVHHHWLRHGSQFGSYR